MYAPGCNAVVVNYRTAADLAGFLATFERHLPTVPWSMTVVNVDPTPADAKVALDWVLSIKAKYGGTCASTISFGSNVGYARACNRGAQFGNREVLALFNADIMFRAGAVDECYEALMSDDSWGVLGPRQVNGEQKIVAGGIFGTNEKPEHRGWRRDDKGSVFRDVRDDATVVVGSAFFIKRQVWDLLRNCPIYQEAAPGAEGAFLPTPLQFEEAAACYHARSHGYRCVYYGPTTILHKLHGSIKANGLATTAATTWWKESQALFRQFCDAHEIAHD